MEFKVKYSKVATDISEMTKYVKMYFSSSKSQCFVEAVLAMASLSFKKFALKFYRDWHIIEAALAELVNNHHRFNPFAPEVLDQHLLCTISIDLCCRFHTVV